MITTEFFAYQLSIAVPTQYRDTIEYSDHHIVQGLQLNKGDHHLVQRSPLSTMINSEYSEYRQQCSDDHCSHWGHVNSDPH